MVKAFASSWQSSLACSAASCAVTAASFAVTAFSLALLASDKLWAAAVALPDASDAESAAAVALLLAFDADVEAASASPVILLMFSFAMVFSARSSAPKPSSSSRTLMFPATSPEVPRSLISGIV